MFISHQREHHDTPTQFYNESSVREEPGHRFGAFDVFHNGFLAALVIKTLRDQVVLKWLFQRQYLRARRREINTKPIARGV